MKVKIGKKTIDAERQAVMLIFENDKERRLVAKQINNMPTARGIRKWCIFPDNMNRAYIRRFMEIPLNGKRGLSSPRRLG